jgi:hypothetical protein
MSLLGIRLSLLIGPTVPIPVPLLLSEALQSVQVTHSDEGSSGCQLTFQLGRSGLLRMLDYPLLSHPLLRPFNRVILVVTVNVRPHVLFDGLITNQQVATGGEPGAATLTITGEDVSYAMNREERTIMHPAQSDEQVARKIIFSYAQYGLWAEVHTPPAPKVTRPTDPAPVQYGTDLEHLRWMAQRHGFVFYITPGPTPGLNIAHWGPPVRLGVPQRAISVNLGSFSNVGSLNFQYDALAPATYSGDVQDPELNRTLPFRSMFSTRPPLASEPALVANQPHVRHRKLRKSGAGLAEAQAEAQGQTDASTEQVLTASGELDAARYGDLLQPRGLVGVRGAGLSFDGLYYVKRVTHTLRHGEYKQQFTLTREGKGTTVPGVRP